MRQAHAVAKHRRVSRVVSRMVKVLGAEGAGEQRVSRVVSRMATRTRERVAEASPGSLRAHLRILGWDVLVWKAEGQAAGED